MDLTEYFTTLARYNVWATGRLLDAVSAVPEDDYRRDVGLFFKSIHGTLNHLLVADNIWFPRFAEGRSPRMALNAELEPDRAQLAARLRADATRWAPLIGTFAAPQWQGMLSYVTTQGVPTSLPFTPTLGHVFNHGTHHRGQVTAALTALGQPAPVIDLVYMLVEEQKQP
jgi:uncharacterized damage-inducible protein DinB